MSFSSVKSSDSRVNSVSAVSNNSTINTRASQSSRASTLLPTNLFYVWYVELCRRANTNPLSMVRPLKPRNDTVLDFHVDRIKLEEWKPILAALRLDTSLHVIALRCRAVRTRFAAGEDKSRAAKLKNAHYLWTDHGLSDLMRSLASTVRRTQVLTCLEFDGVPIESRHLDPLIDAIKKNKSLKMLAFKRCPLMDDGCAKLCTAIRFVTNIEVFNMTACNVTAIGARSIAKLVRHQQINRYCVSWHTSLRYTDPDVDRMAGLKRITLNDNPGIGDDGLKSILDELDDDLWIKAIDMQRCNVTETMSARILDVVGYSKSLEIVDLRHNDRLARRTIEKIFDLLKIKRDDDDESSEFQWCLSTASTTTTTTPSGSSVAFGRNRLGTRPGATVQKSKSAPFDQRADATTPLRRTKTFALLPKKVGATANCRIEVRDGKAAGGAEPVAINKRKIDIRLPQAAANDEVKADKIRKKEFVFAHDASELAQSLLARIVRKGSGAKTRADDAEEEEEEDFSHYFDDGFDLLTRIDKGERSIDNRRANGFDDGFAGSNVSLMRYVHDLRADGGNNERIIVNSRNSNIKCNNNMNNNSKKCKLENANHCNGKKLLVKVAPIR